MEIKAKSMGTNKNYKHEMDFSHKQKCEELVGHGANKNYIHEMDFSHLNGNKFTSDDAKKRKDLHTNSSLHGEFFVLI
jgi:hypothetical protein